MIVSLPHHDAPQPPRENIRVHMRHRCMRGMRARGTAQQQRRSRLRGGKENGRDMRRKPP